MLLDNRLIEVTLRVGEGRVYGARYHTVEPLFPGHIDTWFRDEWKAMEAWCTEVMGIPSEVWALSGKSPPVNQRWYVNSSKFWFRNESDMTMFIMRWS